MRRRPGHSATQGDILVAGHTHGGQVPLSWYGPIMTLSGGPRPWVAGLIRLAGYRRVVVVRGIGMERGHDPRIRFNCRPELVAIELRPVVRGR